MAAFRRQGAGDGRAWAGSFPSPWRWRNKRPAAGADGILALPPYYPEGPDDGTVDYYKAIGTATPLGLLIYSRDWFKPGPELVAKLAEAIPTLVAWKDGQGDLRRFQMIRQRGGRSAGLDRRRGRRHGARLLRHWHPDLHLQHRHGVAGAGAGAGQGRRRPVIRPLC